MFYIEYYFLQLFILYNIYMLYNTENPYYMLFILFIMVVLFGVYLSLVQIELFTGFLWITEFSIIFISIILLFYFNISHKIIKFKNKLYDNLLLNIILLVIIYNNLLNNINIDNNDNFYLNNIDYFDDYYEAKNNFILNDLYGLSIMYYIINNIILIIIGFLLLLCSIICVNLYFSNKNLTILKKNKILKNFNLHKDYINYTFLRKQNLNLQTKKNYFLKILKKIH